MTSEYSAPPEELIDDLDVKDSHPPLYSAAPAKVTPSIPDKKGHLRNRSTQNIECSHDSCDSKAEKGGYCTEHYLLFAKSRVRRRGTVMSKNDNKDNNDDNDDNDDDMKGDKSSNNRTLLRVMDSYLDVLHEEDDNGIKLSSSVHVEGKAGEPSKETIKILAKVLKVAEEMVSTEKTYVRTLKTLVNVFKKGLETYIALDREIISQDNINLMFHNADSIFSIHYKMYQELKQLSQTGHLISGIGKILTQYLPYFRLYTTYVNEYDSAIITLQNTRKANKELDFYITFHEKLQSDIRGTTVTLQSGLITPIQRIPRYLLLIQELIRQLDKANWETVSKTSQEALREAYHAMKDVARIVNESFRLKEARDKVVTLSHRFRGLDKVINPSIEHTKMEKNQISLVLSTRYLVKEGHIEKKHRHRLKNLSAYSSRYALLFNDIIIICSPTKTPEKGKLHVRHIYSLYRMSASSWSLAKTTHGRGSILMSPNVTNSGDKPSDTEYYHLAIKDELRNDTTVIRLHSKEERDEWLDMINLFASRTNQKKIALRHAKGKIVKNDSNPVKKNRTELHALATRTLTGKKDEIIPQPPSDSDYEEDIVEQQQQGEISQDIGDDEEVKSSHVPSSSKSMKKRIKKESVTV